MTVKDSLGHTLTGADAVSAALYETALRQLQLYVEDPVATIDRALERSPGFVMGHAFKAYLHLLGSEPAGLPVARECHWTAAGMPMTGRERGHIAAVGHMAEGRFRAAGRALEDVSIDHPRDALALQAGQILDFFTGDTRMIRDRIARALPAWSPGLPGYHAVLGMLAFGLEETGDYPRAEAAGKRAVALEKRDGWAQHAVAHVMEMQGRQRDGIAWMRADPDAWSRDSFFCIHNWWHLALYHLDLGETGEALALYDGPIFGQRSPVVFDMLDASALLWRLHLRGVPLGDRWAALADNWRAVGPESLYAFNDVHAVMAYVGAGREGEAAAVIERQRQAMAAGSGDNRDFLREAGHDATRAILAFGRGDHAEAVRLLRPIRSVTHRAGGSHAQRDVFDLTLIEAAFRAGERTLAAALANERLAAKPASPLARLFVERAAATVEAVEAAA